ncbi:DUF1810 domain-containing protein [Ramlibacter henchirensis]|uniref:DUF1810 domain-containing protein n=1 Tax=Ramlibacter henchirensis TaxID=204072 RepID=A0A4Z0C4L3_9BURK|nr:DUF1810 domain-containing protein [Ramlibacter henchirensis]TFZ06211.1 DUF1810 domain-containing protein [Ramlibacter henchirensis]
MSADPFHLERFVQAQEPVWSSVCDELRAGRKQSHWMWFVFPQLAVLGRSSMAKHYGLSGLQEAKAYLAHPVLGPRLRSCCEMLLRVQGRTAEDIFGGIDAMKLRSCLTLFMETARDEMVFRECLVKFFAGDVDPFTTGQVGG